MPYYYYVNNARAKCCGFFVLWQFFFIIEMIFYHFSSLHYVSSPRIFFFTNIMIHEMNGIHGYHGNVIDYAYDQCIGVFGSP